MARPQDEIDDDYGLSGLAKLFRYPLPRDESAALGLVGVMADQYEGAYAHQLLEDVLRLLEAPLPDEVIVTLWLGATRAYFDPVEQGLDGRTWLRRIADTCTARICRDDPSFVPFLPETVPDEGLEEAVLSEIREAAPVLTDAAVSSLYARPLPDLVPGLERAVTEVDPGLGFRLFLRAMKGYFVPVGDNPYERYCALGQRFGYNQFVVEDGDFNMEH